VSRSAFFAAWLAGIVSWFTILVFAVLTFRSRLPKGERVRLRGVLHLNVFLDPLLLNPRGRVFRRRLGISLLCFICAFLVGVVAGLVGGLG
jgi:hypothetical protein